MRYRIAFVITELEKGGAENNLARLAIGLHREGHEVTVISVASLPGSQCNSAASQLQAGGVTLESLNCNSIRQYFSARTQLRRLLDKLNPDMVHSYLFHAHVLASHACRKDEIPHIVGLRVAEPRLLRQVALKTVIRHAAQVIAVSHDVKDWARLRLSVHTQNLTHIANSVEIDQFTNVTPSKSPSKGNATWITFVGRLHEQKGLLQAVPLMKQILADAPNAKLLLVGDGPLETKLRSSFSAEISRDQVFLTGRRDDVPNILAATDIFILPSLWEGMPNALMEAMATGLPVVAFDVQGVPELLGKTPGIQCVAANDYEDFKVAIETLLSDSHLRSQLGIENRDRIHDSFSLKAHIETHELTYARILK